MSELILPTPKHSVSEAVHGLIPKYRTALKNKADESQFFSAMVMEVNKLPVDVDANSVLTSCMNASILGLTLGPVLGHAYLVTYKMRREGKTICQLIPGYQGLLELAFRNEFLVQCDPELVLEGEDFERWHDHNGPQFKHVMPIERDIEKANIVGAYCTYRTKLGGTGMVFVTRQELDKVDTGRNVWRDNYPAMAAKTAIRRASKRWRKVGDLGRAVLLDEIAERGEVQPCPEWDDGESPVVDVQKNTRAVLDNTLQRTGSQSVSERDALCQWAVGHDYAEVAADGELMKSALLFINRHTQKHGWDSLLTEVLNGRPADSDMED